MRWCRKDSREACFPTLKALLGRAREQRRVKVELVSGMSFIDEVVEVVGVEADAIAVFSSQRRVALADIDLVAVAELA
jgi:uncharacterized protein YabN with tetrapyrrole methylase and pyrophosphatase domain